MTIKGLIFDFDGLIIDTETPEYQAWQDIYRSRGAELPLEEWVKCVGASYAAFNPMVYLEELTGQSVDHDELFKEQRLRARGYLESETVLPGVQEVLETGREMGLKLAVASSSPREWVYGHLERLGMLAYFDQICTGDQVERVKPDPAVYLRALELLGLQAAEGIAFEDSLNGIRAAKSAGLFTVAIPNPITERLDIRQADLILKSMADYSLNELLHRASSVRV